MYYYGVQPSELELLAFDEFNKMNQALDMFLASDILHQLKVSIFPNLTKQDQEKVHREYYQMSNPGVFETRKRMSLEDVAKVLGWKRNG